MDLANWRKDTKTAHFLEQDYKVFDAPFFSITPKEAKAMDPTHRMLLEVSYEGFENGVSRYHKSFIDKI